MNDSNRPASSVASPTYQTYQASTYLFGGNAPYVEEMYENYLANPGSVPETWRDYFDTPGVRFLFLPGALRLPLSRIRSP